MQERMIEHDVHRRDIQNPLILLASVLQISALLMEISNKTIIRD